MYTKYPNRCTNQEKKYTDFLFYEQNFRRYIVKIVAFSRTMDYITAIECTSIRIFGEHFTFIMFMKKGANK